MLPTFSNKFDESFTFASISKDHTRHVRTCATISKSVVTCSNNIHRPLSSAQYRLLSGTSLMGSFMLLLILVTQISPPSEDIMFVTYICLNMVVVGLATLVSSVMVNLSLRTKPVPRLTRMVSYNSHKTS